MKIRGPDGQLYDFPDDSKDSEILDFFSQTAEPEPKIVPTAYEKYRMERPGEVMMPWGPAHPEEALIPMELAGAAARRTQQVIEPVSTAATDLARNFMQQYGITPPPAGEGLWQGPWPTPIGYAVGQISPEYGKAIDVAAGRIAGGLTEPGTLLSLPFGATKPGLAYFTAGVGAALPEEYRGLIEPQTGPQLLERAIEFGGTAAMGGLLGRGLLGKRPVTPLEREVQRATQERRIQEGRLPEHPGVEEIGLPPEAGGRYSPESAARLEEKAQVLLTPAQEEASRLGLVREFDWVDNFGKEDPEHYQLMKSSAAQVDANGNFVAPGRITVSRAAMDAFMRETAPELQQQALTANFIEEGIHSFTTPAEAAAYAGTLTAAERAIGYRLYRRGAPAAEVRLPGERLGHELLRQRIQQLMKLDTSEVADLAGRQRWSAQSLEFIANIIRRIREWIGTKAAEVGREKTSAVLDRINQNLEAAKKAVKSPGPTEGPPIVKSMPPGSIDPEHIVPAVRLVGGEVRPGLKGDTHPDIIAREELSAEDIDQRGFSDPEGKTFFLDRDAAAQGTQLPTEMEPGRLHSTDLIKAAEAKPEEPFTRRRMVRGYEFDPDIPEKDVQVTVMKFPMPDGTVRQVVQTDGMPGGENIWSLNPELMREAGYDIPTSAEILANIPAGRYRLDQLRKMMPEKPELPEPEPGTVRLYHGEGAAEGAGFGTSWFTKDWGRAATYGDKISYVDVAADVAAEAQRRARQAGSGTASDHLLAPEDYKEARDLPERLQPKVYDVEAPAARRRVRPYGFWIDAMGKEIPVESEYAHTEKAQQIFPDIDPEGDIYDQMQRRGYSRAVFGMGNNLMIEIPQGPVSTAIESTARRLGEKYDVDVEGEFPNGRRIKLYERPPPPETQQELFARRRAEEQFWHRPLNEVYKDLESARSMWRGAHNHPAHELLGKFIENGWYAHDPGIEALAKKMHELGDKGVVFKVDKIENYREGEYIPEEYFYESDLDTINVSDSDIIQQHSMFHGMDPNKQMSLILIHEYTHGLTTKGLESGPERKQISDLMDKTRQWLNENVVDPETKGQLEYALQNPYEFIAQTFERRKVQDVLKKIPATDVYKGRSLISNIFDKFVRMVGRIIGFEDHQAISDVIKIALKLGAQRPPARYPQLGLFGEQFPMTRRRVRPTGPELPLGPITPGARLTRPEAGPTALEALAAHQAGMFPPVTATALERTAGEYFAETTAPDLAGFASRARATFGADIKPGQVRSVFEEAMWRRLETASGDELGRMVKDLGLAKRLRLETPEGEIRKIADPLEVEQAKAMEAAGPPAQPTFEAIVKRPRLGALERPEQKFRANVIATIADKLLIKGEGSRDFLKRTDIDPASELSDPAVQTKEPIYNEFRESDQIDPNLPDRLVQDARAFGGEKVRRVIGGQVVTLRKKGFPVSASKRLTAVQSKATGKVYLVSTYRDGRRGPVMVDPVSPTGAHVRVADALNRYRVVASALLDEPVQDFKKEYKSLSDYEGKFGADARSAERQIAGYAAPEAVTQAVPYRTMPSEVVTPEESARIMDQIVDEIGKVQSADDIKAAWEGLEVSPIGRQAISGLQKIGREIMRKEPALTEEQFLDRLANTIYENHTKAKDFEDFQRLTMEASRPPVSEAARVEAQRRELEAERRRAAREAARPPVVPTGARELTMPREIAPTAIRGEELPKGAPPEPHPIGRVPVPPEMLTPQERAFVAEEAAREHPPLKRRKVVSLYDLPLPEGEAPASLRRRAIQVADESRRIRLGLSTMMQRREMMREFPRTLDAAENIGNNEGYRAEINVRGVTRRGTSKLWHGDPEVLASAKTLISAKAIVPLYNWTPNLRTILQDLINKHPGINAAKGLMRPGPAQNITAGRALFARIRQESIQQMVENGDLKAEAPSYSFDPNAVTALNVFENDVNKGIRHANRLIARSIGKDRLKGHAWLKAANDLMGEINYARAHWNDPALIETATRMRRELDRRYDRERTAGYRMRYDPGYAPGRYDGEFFNDDSVVFGEGRPTILGRLWRNAKTFRNYYEAIGDPNGPYIPMTRDSASIVGHRVRQGERAIQKKDWVESLKDYDDPVTGTPIALPPKLDPVTKKLGSPNPNYELMYLRPGHDPIAVRKGYTRLMRQLTSTSFIEDWAPTRQVLEWGQRLKHTILLGDFFHLARLSYYAMSIMGTKMGHRKGLTALEFREADIPEAVRNGIISAEEARWATERIPIRAGNLIHRVSRIELMREFERGGLNIGRIQDAIYKDLVAGVPLLGRYNKWLFDRYTRGLMAQSAIVEFERIQKANPMIMPEVLIRDISRDLNQYFGSIGRQGIFKSKGLQDLSRMIFLAPQWVEGLIDKEVMASARLLGTPLHAMGIYRKNLTPLGTMGRGIGRGLVAMLALTQVINLITKRQSTFKNEPEHMFDAWIPSLEGEGKGFYLSPFAVFNELTHDLIRLGAQKPKFMDAVNQIGSNKLSPWGRMGLVLITSQTPTHQYITSSPELIATAGKQLIPIPISFGKFAQFGLHYAIPGTVPPAQPAALQRQALASFGLKIEPDIEPPLKVTRLAQDFVRKEYGRTETIHITPTTEPSYPRLRNALRMKDYAGAEKIVRELQSTKTDKQIVAAMKLDARHPFTGAKKYEKQFIGTLNAEQLGLYDKAVEQREREYQDFLNWFGSIPAR